MNNITGMRGESSPRGWKVAVRAKSKIPDRVKVLGHEIDVEVVPVDEIMDGDHPELDPEDQGCYIEREQMIFLRSDMGPDAERETLLHEVCHALESGLGMGLSENANNRLARGLLLLIRENPELMAFLVSS